MLKQVLDLLYLGLGLPGGVILGKGCGSWFLWGAHWHGHRGAVSSCRTRYFISVTLRLCNSLRKVVLQMAGALQ
jgi:hypothetical protein